MFLTVKVRLGFWSGNLKLIIQKESLGIQFVCVDLKTLIYIYIYGIKNEASDGRDKRLHGGNAKEEGERDGTKWLNGNWKRFVLFFCF